MRMTYMAKLFHWTAMFLRRPAIGGGILTSIVLLAPSAVTLVGSEPSADGVCDDHPQRH